MLDSSGRERNKGRNYVQCVFQFGNSKLEYETENQKPVGTWER